jgi:hypothetical protein
MTCCPTCGRLHRQRRAAARITPLPLFDWVPPPKRASSSAPIARLVLLHGCADAGGDPRPALVIPGRRWPVAFPNITAALAAKRAMEASR